MTYAKAYLHGFNRTLFAASKQAQAERLRSMPRDDRSEPRNRAAPGRPPHAQASEARRATSPAQQGEESRAQKGAPRTPAERRRRDFIKGFMNGFKETGPPRAGPMFYRREFARDDDSASRSASQTSRVFSRASIDTRRRMVSAQTSHKSPPTASRSQISHTDVSPFVGCRHAPGRTIHERLDEESIREPRDLRPRIIRKPRLQRRRF